MFGYIIERREFCSATAVTSFLFFRDVKYYKILVVAISIETIFFFVLSITECTPCLSTGFSIILSPIGGLLFGAGMILSAGCASGACYKVGEGNGQAIFALITFSLTGYFLSRYLPIKEFLIVIQENSTLIGQENPTLFTIIEIPRIVPVLAVLILLVVFIEINLWQNREFMLKTPLKQQYQELKSSWWLTAVALGLLGTAAFILSRTTGRNSGISLANGLINDIAGSIDIIFGGESTFGWGGMFVIGTITGAFLSAKQLKRFKLSIPRKRTAIKAICGGILMGTGAVLTGNCNIGHLFSGLPIFSISSITTLVFIYLGSIITVKIM
jgi:uncharacterized membrane protein YedE/YeeE